MLLELPVLHFLVRFRASDGFMVGEGRTALHFLTSTFKAFRLLTDLRLGKGSTVEAGMTTTAKRDGLSICL
jgi:hypothetical protein